MPKTPRYLLAPPAIPILLFPISTSTVAPNLESDINDNFPNEDTHSDSAPISIASSIPSIRDRLAIKQKPSPMSIMLKKYYKGDINYHPYLPSFNAGLHLVKDVSEEQFCSVKYRIEARKQEILVDLISLFWKLDKVIVV